MLVTTAAYQLAADALCVVIANDVFGRQFVLTPSNTDNQAGRVGSGAWPRAPGGEVAIVAGDAELFAEIAVELDGRADLGETVATVVSHALSAVGAEAASVMLLHNRGRDIEVAGTTGPSATRADELQLELGEGPCIDAARENAAMATITDTCTNTRWRRWSARVSRELGIRSVLSVQLGIPRDRVGALNLYAGQPDRFDHDDATVAKVLARHAALALARTQRERNLWQAIDARKLIGQAQGMLMERYDVDDVRAFAILRRYSMDYNVKLNEVARRLIADRRLPEPDTNTDPGRSHDVRGR